MKTIYRLMAVLALLSSCGKAPAQEGQEQEETVNKKSKVEMGKTIRSEILGRSVRYTIYLPAGYEESQEDYPVLYLLHGYDFTGDNEKGDLAWMSSGSMVQSTDSALKNGSLSDLIVVMPSGFNAFYVNGYLNGMRYEDFFFEELIPYIEANYKVRADRGSRAIAGLSMGGYGTTLYAFKHPDTFCMAYSMSGAVSGNGYVQTPRSVIEKALTEGAKPESFPYYIMEVGTGDQIQGLYNANVEFDKYLSDKDIDHKYIERSGGHDWTFWTECYKKCLVALGDYFGK